MWLVVSESYNNACAYVVQDIEFSGSSRDYPLSVMEERACPLTVVKEMVCPFPLTVTKERVYPLTLMGGEGVSINCE